MYQKIVDTCSVFALVVIAVTLTLLTIVFLSDKMFINIMSMDDIYESTSALSEGMDSMLSETPSRENLFQDELFQLIRGLNPAEFEEFSALKGNEREEFLKKRGFVFRGKR